MAKNKYDFIRDLLIDKKITQNQRERILKLASREIKFDGTLEDIVKKIEEVIFNINTGNSIHNLEVISNKHENITLKDYKDPYYLYKFLFEYNQNPVLRTTCHDIDSDELHKINKFCNTKNYNFPKHLNKIIANYVQHEKTYLAPRQVKGLVRGYLTGKDYKGNELRDGWTTSKIRINWSSPQLSEWTSKNFDIPPNINEVKAGELEIELFSIYPQIDSPITYEPIQSFTQLVLHFKNLFHLKSGKQSLKAIIERINNHRKWNEKIDFIINGDSFESNLEHFTDVDKLTQAYNKIIEIIIKHHIRGDKPKVKLSFYEENKKVIFSIYHLNGMYDKTINNTLDRPFGQSYSSLIEKQINGLCNLRLNAHFGNGKCAEINLWDGKKIEAIKIPIFEGVEHLLEFPKFKSR